MRVTSRRNSTYWIDRRGAAAVEFAILLPLLMFLVVVAIDFCRLFHQYTVITNCARNGALYACDPIAALDSPYANVTAAALADAPGLTPTPTVSSGVDDDGNVEVTVEYEFSLITEFLGFGTKTLSHTVRMSVAPALPDT